MITHDKHVSKRVIAKDYGVPHHLWLSSAERSNLSNHRARKSGLWDLLPSQAPLKVNLFLPRQATSVTTSQSQTYPQTTSCPAQTVKQESASCRGGVEGREKVVRRLFYPHIVEHPSRTSAQEGRDAFSSSCP